MMKPLQHLKTVTKHKMLVMKNCFRVGLYKQGLIHDLSKFGKIEFLVGCKYYQGVRSPNNAEREENGHSLAWLHHKGRNKHHYEYWIDYGSKGMEGMRMPECYVVEMFIDRIAASRTYQKETYTDRSPLEYYKQGRAYTAPYMHKESRKLLEKLLILLARHGEKKTFAYIRQEVVNKNRRAPS